MTHLRMESTAALEQVSSASQLARNVKTPWQDTHKPVIAATWAPRCVIRGQNQVSGCSIYLSSDAQPKGSFRFEATTYGPYSNTRGYIPVCRETGTAITTNMPTVSQCRFDSTVRVSAPEVDNIDEKDCEPHEEEAGVIAALVSLFCFCGCVGGMAYVTYLLCCQRSRDQVQPGQVVMRAPYAGHNPAWDAPSNQHPAPPPPAPPPGYSQAGDWQTVTDPATGKMYEHNIVTNETRWLPESQHGSLANRGTASVAMAIPVNTGGDGKAQPVMAVAHPAAGSQHSANNQWQRTTDPASGRDYEYNAVTNETRWL